MKVSTAAAVLVRLLVSEENCCFYTLFCHISLRKYSLHITTAVNDFIYILFSIKSLGLIIYLKIKVYAH